MLVAGSLSLPLRDAFTYVFADGLSIMVVVEQISEKGLVC